MPNKKYFIAIVLPSPVLEMVECFKHELYNEYGLKGALRSPSHITLHRPFEWREEKENQLINTLQSFKFEASFQVSLVDFSFFEPRVVYVAVSHSETLFNLHNNLKQHVKLYLKVFNEDNDLRGFHPHVTIANRDLKKPLFYQLQQRFKRQTFNAEFQCNQFSLLKLQQKWEVCHSFLFHDSN